MFYILLTIDVQSCQKLLCISSSKVQFRPLKHTLQLAAEKRGLNNYPSKDNFYSIKMALETLVNWAKIRFKAQFERILIFQVYVLYLVFLRKKWLHVQKLPVQRCNCAVSLLSQRSTLAKLGGHLLSYTHLTLTLHNRSVTYMNTFKSPKMP